MKIVVTTMKAFGVVLAVGALVLVAVIATAMVGLSFDLALDMVQITEIGVVTFLGSLVALAAVQVPKLARAIFNGARGATSELRYQSSPNTGAQSNRVLATGLLSGLGAHTAADDLDSTGIQLNRYGGGNDADMDSSFDHSHMESPALFD